MVSCLVCIMILFFLIHEFKCTESEYDHKFMNLKYIYIYIYIYIIYIYIYINSAKIFETKRFRLSPSSEFQDTLD